ncbi:hypothetical protein ACLK1T_22985 [Escherichia coli]
MPRREIKKNYCRLGRALDRVLTWNYYMLPMWYMAEDRLAWWDKFSQPAGRPVYSLGIDTWWYDVNKSDAVSQTTGRVDGR